MDIIIDKIKSISLYCSSELEKGRPNVDKPHTIAVVHYVEQIIKNTSGLNIDPYVLIISAYTHDWGYANLFEEGKNIQGVDVENAKSDHMRIGSDKAKLLLTDKFFDFLTSEQKEQIVHIVSIHDKVDEIRTENEKVLFEADTLGGLDTNFWKPNFDKESNDKYLLKVKEKRLPLFISEYGKNKFNELYELRNKFYYFKENQKSNDKVVFKESGKYKGRKYKIDLLFGNPGILPKIDQAQAIAFLEENERLNIVFFKHIEGHYGNPGGGVEKGETFLDTLRREAIEEINCELIDFGPVGYEIVDYPETNERLYFGRYWITVKKLPGKVNDPCGKALERVIVPYDKAIEVLGWGEKGKLLIEEAYRQITN